MKKIVFVFLFSFYSIVALASHITGGEMIYTYLRAGNAPNTRIYRVTLKLFRDQNTIGAPMPTSVYIGIFDNDNGSQVPASINAPYFETYADTERNVNINPYPPCVKNATALEYHVGYFSQEVQLPNNSSGYTVTYQTCCRVNPLNNVSTDAGSGGTGSSYTCVIPPIIDTSPSFSSSIDLICQNRAFTLDFKATDADGDSLVYSFIEAYNGGKAQNASNINPAAPPYIAVKYFSGYGGGSPLGEDASINALTGVISGIAPTAGKYVVSVRVRSFKGGKYVGEHRKDFIVNVGDCDVPGASLQPKPVTCNGYSVGFVNNNPSALNKTTYWDFGDPKSGLLNTSTLANPTHVYSDTGVFVYKLVVNRGQSCSDSTTQTVKVYPGFSPGFISSGQCKNTAINFTDTSKSKYGRINKWSWNFGDPEATEDISGLKDPSHIFTVSNNYTVKLIVSDTRGCIDTASLTIAIKDKPDLNITNDTLICTLDTLRLNASGAGTFFWTPAYNISNQNVASPLVSPDRPTTYYANFSDAFGCKGIDSVFVDVKNSVVLEAGNDTTICSTDAVRLNPVSDALYYKWTPSTYLDNDSLKNPTAIPLRNITYTLVASIGKCRSTDAIRIKVAPYPVARAGNDSAICLGSNIQLNASGGTFYRWSPAFFLNNPGIAAPLASPINDISYVVSVSDTLGCPKSVRDTVQIRVINIIADAGPTDTTVVVDQPLQLNASGGEFYIWQPATGLSNPNINDPVAILKNSQQYVVNVSAFGCFDTDTINVTVYKVDPGLYVPNAFTPNSDGINDVFRPIPIGMKAISNFRVYNRWGKLMFSSSQIGKGWDGTFSGKAQDPAVYAWMVEGIDYLNKKITRKGSVVLIR